MNYHNILHDDMLNGPGIRVVLFVSGCTHHCSNCQNPETWSPNSGILFDEKALNELFKYLDKPYCSGITFSGGDPLHPCNTSEISKIVYSIRNKYGDKKSIWLYTGFKWEDLAHKGNEDLEFLKEIDILVDGRYEDDKSDVNFPWRGSTNQRLIDVKKSLEYNTTVIYEIGGI